MFAPARMERSFSATLEPYRMRNRVIHALKRKPISPQMILDVGANVGQSVREFREAFPNATIHAFEPIRVTYAQLSAYVASDGQSHAHQIALSRANGDLQMTSRGASTGNRVVENGKVGDIESVPALMGDTFCAEHGIDAIDFLKVDAEGHDLDVVLGFREMLLGARVKFVQVECGLSPANSIHVSFSNISSLIFSFGFGLYGLFGLTPLRGTPNLSAHYGDAVFVHERALSRSDRD